MTFTIKVLTVALSAVLVLSACGKKQETEHEAHSHGDLQEKTASADVLPSFLDGQSDEMRLIYEAAGKATDLLQWIPCYCGCGESAGHTSNMNCFVKEIQADGSVVWDDHGTRCGVCLQIAAQSINWKMEGKTVKEIRAEIDKAYEKGYAKPTKTPMPA